MAGGVAATVAASGLTKAGLYHHVKTKEAILVEIGARMVGQIAQQAGAHRRSGGAARAWPALRSRVVASSEAPARRKIPLPPRGYWDRVQEICRKYDVLLHIDEVAYIRFASVYRSFASLEDFEAEIAALRENRPATDAEHRRPVVDVTASPPLPAADGDEQLDRLVDAQATSP